MADRSLIWRSRERRIVLRSASLFLIILACSTGAAHATASNPDQPSAERGHAIAVGGGPGGAGAACFSCHGLQGQGDGGAAFPRLAGLDAQYLARQMAD